jgi:hypothetical protein
MKATRMALFITPPAPLTNGLTDGPAYFVVRDDSKPAMKSTIVSFEFANLEDAKAAYAALSRAAVRAARAD